MTQIWMDGFDHYGTGEVGVLNMLNGPWAEIEEGVSGLSDDPTGPVAPSFGARTGDYAMLFNRSGFGRRVIGTSKSTVMVAFGFYVPELPDRNDRVALVAFLFAGNQSQGTLFLQTDGSLTLRGVSTEENEWATASSIGSSSGSVIRAGTWHHVECKFVRGDGTGALEVRVDEEVVMNLSSLSTGTDDVTQFFFGWPSTPPGQSQASVPYGVFYDDVICRDTSGTYNNDFEGDLRVGLLQVIGNGSEQGWSARTISKLGVGVLNLKAATDDEDDDDRDDGVTFPDAAVLEIGSDDFCTETFVRFDSLPLTTEKWVIASKWDETNDDRSWRLLLNGPDADGTLSFEVSSDGTVGAVTEIHAFPFIPETKRWYHVAVARDGTNSKMFLDGEQIGVTATDSVTYHDGDADLIIGGQQGAEAGVIEEDSSIEGWVDAFRLTIGDARYTANFTPPTAALPDNVSGDPLYADVMLLLNFDDEAIIDESANDLTGTARNTAYVEIPDDASAYKTIDGATPNDDNFVEAALVAATGTLTLTDNPTNTEDVTIGTQTYTFVTTLSGADDVLIGADAEETLDNLVAAVNAEAGEGTTYGSGTTQNADAYLTDLPNDQVLATARTPGAAGNSVATTENLANGSWGAATLEGGADIPGESEFLLSSLAPEVTAIAAIELVGRAFKTDAGSSELTMSFVLAGGTSASGSAHPLGTTPAYYNDTIEEDPFTLAQLTPSSLVQSLIRIDRTA